MISYHTKRAQRYNSAAQRPAAVKLPSRLQLYARVAAVVVGDYFDRSLRCSTHLYATTSRCCCFLQVKCQVKCRRNVQGSFEYHISTQMVLIYMFMLVCFLCDIVPYQESTTLQLCRTAAAVGNTIYVRLQMTANRQHAESTTLACDALPVYTPLPLAATAAFGKCVKRHAGVKCKDRLNIIVVLKRSLYSCSCWCASYMISCHTKRAQLYPTAAALSNIIYVRSQMTDSRQHAESTTLQPCRTTAAVGDTIYVRLARPRYAAASCLLCRSLS